MKFVIAFGNCFNQGKLFVLIIFKIYAYFLNRVVRIFNLLISNNGAYFKIKCLVFINNFNKILVTIAFLKWMLIVLMAMLSKIQKCCTLEVFF